MTNSTVEVFGGGSPRFERKFAVGTARFQQLVYASITVGVPTLGVIFAVYRVISQGVAAYELFLFATMYLLSGLGIEAGFHRYFSHRAFRGPQFTTYLLGAWGSMAAQGPVLFWAATHREHHAATDREGDPHSPYASSLPGGKPKGRLAGLFHAHVGWLFQPLSGNWAKLVPDLLRDRDVIFINSSYPVWVVVGLLVPSLFGFFLAGWDGVLGGLLWGGLVRIAALDHMTWAVNSIGHTLGSQPFRSGDQSRNVAWLALPTMGGAWHNNHHAFPSSATLDFKFYQIDGSGIFVRVLSTLGLASKLNRPTPQKRQQRR